MRLYESLDGWWHAFFKANPSGRGDLAATQALIGQSVDWDNLVDHKESVRVPGIWRDTRPGFRGVVWYWRPFVIPSDWITGTVSLHFSALRGQAELYLDGIRIARKCSAGLTFTAVLGQVLPDKLYSLALWVAYIDDSGGICGSVNLISCRREND